MGDFFPTLDTHLAVRYATWDENLASHTPEVQAAARALEAIIREMPGRRRPVRPRQRAAGLRPVDRRCVTCCFALIPHAGWVNLQLADGALLPNPDDLIEGTGKKIRHIKVRSSDAAKSDRVREVVRAQLSQR